jgi:hypothetical protein
MAPDHGAQDPEKTARIHAAMERVTAYIKAGKFDEVREVLASKHISASTLRNWVKQPTKVFTAYRWNEFAEAIDKLPDLERQKRNQAYEFALAELNISREVQRELEGYNGNYRVLHDFPDIQLDNFAIRVERAPFVVTFAFRYRNKDRVLGFCDGLIVTRHGRLVLAGFSPSTIFQAVFRCVPRPAEMLIRGMAFIEDFNTHDVYLSQIVLAARGSAALDNYREDAEKFVQNSGRTL